MHEVKMRKGELMLPNDAQKYKKRVFQYVYGKCMQKGKKREMLPNCCPEFFIALLRGYKTQ
jgi:hypothetical protein